MMYSEIFPPDNPEDITELAIDGNEKVIVKCGEDNAPSKRAGRPPARKKLKPFSNGWLMISAPSTDGIVAVEYMHKPECNEAKIRSL